MKEELALLMIDLSKALQCILLDLFNKKPHARFLD